MIALKQQKSGRNGKRVFFLLLQNVTVVELAYNTIAKLSQANRLFSFKSKELLICRLAQNVQHISLKSWQQTW